jgi:hypothetical protein
MTRRRAGKKTPRRWLIGRSCHLGCRLINATTFVFSNAAVHCAEPRRVDSALSLSLVVPPAGAAFQVLH